MQKQTTIRNSEAVPQQKTQPIPQPSPQSVPRPVRRTRGQKAAAFLWSLFGTIVGIVFIGTMIYGIGEKLLDFLPVVEPLTSSRIYIPQPIPQAAVMPEQKKQTAATEGAKVQTTTAIMPTATVKIVEPAPPPPPVTVTTNATYRGYQIRIDMTGSELTCTVDALQISTKSYYSALRGINDALFRTATGMASWELENTYAGADKDGNGYLNWDEITQFQRWLVHTNTYKVNNVALRPYQFMLQRGGDCEDWALFTCGLLRYWGWESYVGAFMPAGG